MRIPALIVTVMLLASACGSTPDVVTTGAGNSDRDGPRFPRRSPKRHQRPPYRPRHRSKLTAHRNPLSSRLLYLAPGRRLTQPTSC